MKLITSKKSELVDWELYEVIPRVYAVKVTDSYQRGMLFLRYQEYYESPYNRFRGKNFDIFVFMDYYRKARGVKAFLYPRDWSGYNIPSNYLTKCYVNLKGGTPYDEEMGQIIVKVMEDLKAKFSREKTPKFYLIGVDKIEGGIMDHEISHAFFYLNSKYRKAVTDLVKKMSKKKYEGMRKIILELGYREDVIVDEIQAFMSTGLWDVMKNVVSEKDCDPFAKNFSEHVGRENLVRDYGEGSEG